MSFLTSIKSIECTRAENKLNTYGGPLQKFNVGDRVSFYLPPNSKEATHMGKNPNHMLQYKGPGIITESLSPNNTDFKIK